MRKAFFEALFGQAEADARVTLVTADMGYRQVEEHAARRPRQFVNVGIAEQAMTGIAAGLAMVGRIAFTYSIANFPTLRCYEQIRNDVCYHNANVKIVTGGAGLAYGALGVTHHTGEDLALMRVLPNMTVVAPGDPWEAYEATRAATLHEGPVYLRIGRGGEGRVHAPGARFELGRAIRVREGSALGLVATGSMLESAVAIADELAKGGTDAAVLSVHTLKPLDEGAILGLARRVPLIATLEEHSIMGGLGGAVAEVLAEAGLVRPPLLKRFGFPPRFPSIVGGQEYLRAQVGLSREGILSELRALLDKSASITATPKGHP